MRMVSIHSCKADKSFREFNSIQGILPGNASEKRQLLSESEAMQIAESLERWKDDAQIFILRIFIITMRVCIQNFNFYWPVIEFFE